MKTSTFVLAGVAVAAGVFGGLQADHYLKNRGVGAPAPVVAFRESGATIKPVAYEGAAATAAPFDFRVAAKKVTPSVVSIDQYRTMDNRDFLGRPMGSPVEREVGQGSGVILTEDGLIVTNNHVVAGGTKFKVHLSDGRTLDAKVVGEPDPRSDLAVIKVDAKGLTPIEIAPIESVQVGQWVLAVGNPLGFSNTVSVGVVSSLKRDLPVGQAGLVDAIQTDAAINPGNSGGALCDDQGRLIGINSAIASGTGGSVGLGFSIPVDRVKSVVSDIKQYGYAKYAALGIERYPEDEILSSPEARQQIAERAGGENVPEKGILVMNAPGAAGKAGIGKYDVITSIDGKPMSNFFTLNKALMGRKPGETVSVEYWSKGQTKKAQVTLQDLPHETRL